MVKINKRNYQTLKAALLCMRSSSAMAISGAALSFDLGEYESGGLNALLELLNLPGLGMGDEMMCDQCQVTKQKASKRVSD